MKRYVIPIVVAVTSLTLVVALVATGTLAVPNVLAGSPWYGHAGWGGPWSRDSGWQLPAELQGLQDVPAEQRFSHFLGARLSLRDKNNQPLTVEVTPGKVTAASATSLTVAANDGSTRTFALDANTMIGSKHARQGEASPPTIAQGDRVVVVQLDTSPAAQAVMVVPPNGLGPRGPWGPGR